MKLRNLFATATLLLSFASLNAQAQELSGDALYGKWLYTHILMEGGREIKVGLTTTFLENGSVVYSDPLGNERGRGLFTIENNTILYEDSNGPQEWKLVSLENGILHVDHKGADMFFERQ